MCSLAAEARKSEAYGGFGGSRSEVVEDTVPERCNAALRAPVLR
jgi:hypothetical protein